ncbi:MAG: hypothetical protein Q8N83_04430 [Ignavibacteria bacterium]|nr:hypothetical protein [Ignavibacteria bacterium]
MDNLINILVAIIIIYSFLAPLFKKKKDGGAEFPGGINPPRPNQRQKPSYSGTDYDILTEIEEMMNRGKNPPVQTLPQKEEVEIKFSGEHQITESEHKVDAREKSVPYEYRKFKISEDERLSLERDLEKQFTSQRKVYYNPVFARVKNSFQNKADFKNGFIISEILGKPKALRR